ncbi:Cytochrome P450 monooxygenase pyr3 [Lasiodiplodia hormozganensis]|uniref:Cytochrome P450 monooxygenase pyr3 n=1 Tax=Lasiodiplodia hormozganensis TaxID=869390 RepID=A0AA39Z7S7_9PEZI|nr:Cytochrome P450 monooxygenase pyr3 [Lasiodiplodia hormozganensis]
MAIQMALFESEQPFQVGFPYLIGAATVLLALLWHLVQDEKPYPGFPLIGKQKGEWLNTKAKERMINHANEILKDGYKRYNGKPFQVIADTGPTIILSPQMAQEIRNDDRLSFMQAVERVFLPWYKGLEPFGAGVSEHDVFRVSIRQNLTQSLGSITESLSQETTYVLNLLLPDVTTEWTGVTWVPVAAKIAARLSAKVFLGEPLCRNEEWLTLSLTYAIDGFQAARDLRWWPPFMRRLVHAFSPEFGKLQAKMKEARRIIEPEVAARKRARREALLAGEKPHKAADAIEWMDEHAQDEPYDIPLAQVALSFAAIHTTSGMISSLLWELTANPEYIDDLRKEIIDVISDDGGWKKTSLYKMKLLDSCMKEAQRLHVIGALAMNRKVTTPVTLSDGTYLPAGTHLALPTWPMKDPDFYGPDADKFDGRRFLEKREQPGNEHRWQFVTTSPEHLGFGHGQHACPGRFFASNEIKIAMAHLLLKYDWKFEGEPPLKSLRESEWVPDPTAKIWVKKREPEIQL